MKVFSCQACGQVLYFENIRCEKCGHILGYLPDRTTITALEPLDGDGWLAFGTKTRRYRFCKNQQFGVCNWLVPARSREEYCTACRHNHIIPDLVEGENQALWARIEAAKHRLFYALLRLELPLANRGDDPAHGLAFDFLSEPPQTHGQNVMTGHDSGLITLAVREADDAERERVRTAMGEPYRTLLGHFRHEVGHYFWDVLVRDAGSVESFRALFGDERQDYAAALQCHYSNGPPPNWQENFVSAYASSHPWEDFAETWAHYLHIIDTLETGASFGLRIRVKPGWATKLSATLAMDAYGAADFGDLIDAWLPLTFAVNSLNRSMGLSDIYPFILSPAAIAKLGYVHDLMGRSRRDSRIAVPAELHAG